MLLAYYYKSDSLIAENGALRALEAETEMEVHS